MPRILLAEDNPSDVYLIRIALQEHGIDVPLASGRRRQERCCRSSAGRSRSTETELNLIILDLNLPRHDGIEILRRLRGMRNCSPAFP